MHDEPSLYESISSIPNGIREIGSEIADAGKILGKMGRYLLESTFALTTASRHLKDADERNNISEGEFFGEYILPSVFFVFGHIMGASASYAAAGSKGVVAYGAISSLTNITSILYELGRDSAEAKKQEQIEMSRLNHNSLDKLFRQQSESFHNN